MDTIDKDILLDFFNNGDGYVFDFSTDRFNNFTRESIGEELCRKYNLSQGKSLTKYFSECSDEKIIKLSTNLLRYYEAKLYDNSIYGTDKKHKQYEKCKCLLEKYKINSIVDISTIQNINRGYIISITKRANEDIQNGNFDSAITKARTLIEEVFCFAIEKQNQKPTDSGNIIKLYTQVKLLYNMHQNRETDKRINDLLSGLDKIIMSISEMRNKSSDSHGVGNKRIAIKEHHAQLFVNSAMTVADFLISVVNNKI